jgi:hypothetical protein
MLFLNELSDAIGIKVFKQLPTTTLENVILGLKIFSSGQISYKLSL